MTPIEKRNALVKKIIRAALGDRDLEDEDMLERAQLCANAAMSIISALKDDDVFEEAIAKFSDNDRAVQREIRAAVDRLTHIDDEATTFAKALAREHMTGGQDASSARSAFASVKSSVSKPSVNQP